MTATATRVTSHRRTLFHWVKQRIWNLGPDESCGRAWVTEDDALFVHAVPDNLQERVSGCQLSKRNGFNLEREKEIAPKQLRLSHGRLARHQKDAFRQPSQYVGPACHNNLSSPVGLRRGPVFKQSPIEHAAKVVPGHPADEAPVSGPLR